MMNWFSTGPLAGEVGAAYGFNVTDTGIGTKIVNVGTSGAAFNVENGADRPILQLLLATNELTDMPDGQSGFAYIYDQNGDGVIDSFGGVEKGTFYFFESVGPQTGERGRRFQRVLR